MSEEVRQKKLAEIQKKIEKENAENVLVLQKKWRCEHCRIAHPTSGKRFPEHRGGCYEKLKSKKDRRIADKEIEKEIEKCFNDANLTAGSMLYAFQYLLQSEVLTLCQNNKCERLQDL